MIWFYSDRLAGRALFLRNSVQSFTGKKEKTANAQKLLVTGPIIPTLRSSLQNKFSAFQDLIFYDSKDCKTNQLYKSF